MKVLFLDIDGVLNSHRFFLSDGAYRHEAFTYTSNAGRKRHITEVDPSALLLLGYFLERAPDYKLVAHSSWVKRFDADDLTKIFSHFGFKHTFHDVAVDGKFSGDRWDRVNDYCKAHPEITECIILDDCPLTELNRETCILPEKNLVLCTDPTVGFTPNDLYDMLGFVGLNPPCILL